MEHTDSMTDLSFTRQFSINPCIPHFTYYLFYSLTSDQVHGDKRCRFPGLAH